MGFELYDGEVPDSRRAGPGSGSARFGGKSASDLAWEEHREKIHPLKLFVYGLRMQGVSYPRIAEALGQKFGGTVPHATTLKRWVTEAIRAVEAEPLAEMRQMEIDRINTVISEAVQIYQALKNMPGVPAEVLLKALDRIARFSESKRRLIGADAPEQVEITAKSPAEEALEERIKVAQRRAAGEVSDIRSGAVSA